MDRIFMDEYYEHLRADNIEAFSKERNDEYVGRAEEYKAAKLALLEGLGLEHMWNKGLCFISILIMCAIGIALMFVKQKPEKREAKKTQHTAPKKGW